VFSFPFIAHDTIFLFRGTVDYVDTCFQCFLLRQIPCNICYILQYFFEGQFWLWVCSISETLLSLYAVKRVGRNKIQIYGLKHGVTSWENKFKPLPARGHYILSQKS